MKIGKHKIGFQQSLGGILNAYREKDLSFDEAQIEIIKFFKKIMKDGFFKNCLQYIDDIPDDIFNEVMK